jgi:hypothetical protein
MLPRLRAAHAVGDDIEADRRRYQVIIFVISPDATRVRRPIGLDHEFSDYTLFGPRRVRSL